MKHASYLKHLKWNEKLSSSIQARYLRNPRLLVLILLFVLILGFTNYGRLPRRLNPEIKIPLVIVSTVLPGANSNDIESLITDPIEKSLSGVDKIKTYMSSSRDSVSVIQVEFNSGTDADRATTDVKSAVDSVTLPGDTQKPMVKKLDFEQFPVWSFSLTSTQKDTASLISFSKELKKRLEALSAVDSVSVSGLEEQEIQIVIKSDAISTYQFNPQVLFQAISVAAKSLPAGSVRTENSTFTLSIDPTISAIEDIRNIKVNLGETIVNLSDIATVSQRSKPSQAQSYVAQNRSAARQAVSFSVFKVSTANIDKTVGDAKKETDNMLATYNNQFSLFTTSDISKQIDDQFSELVRDFAITIFLVFLALLIFLGIRQAVVASISIPITFLISFTIMSVFGIALSFISFFSLLLVLGLLVDDTIVVISATTAYHRSGKFTPFQTGLLVWRDFILPIFTTTLTTVWAFVPLLLSSGIIGEFIKPIPIVVSSTLMASFFVAMFITLPIIVFLLSPSLPKRVKYLLTGFGIIFLFFFVKSLSGGGALLPFEILAMALLLFVLYQTKDLLIGRFKKQTAVRGGTLKGYFDHGVLSFEGVSIKYQLLIRRILASGQLVKSVIVMVIIFSIFSYLLLPFGFVKAEFFPKQDAESVFVSVELPPGTNINRTKKEALSVVEILQSEDDVNTASLNLGQSFSPDQGAASSEGNNFLLTLVLDKKRKRSSSEVSEAIRQKMKNYTVGKLSVIEESGGPPAGADIQIKLLGPDLSVLDKYADQVIAYLKKQSGVTNVDKSIKPGTSKITFIPDRQKLSEAGIGLDQVSFYLRTFASGAKLTSVKFGNMSDTEQDITLRFSNNDQFVESVGSLLIPTLTGQSIPLTSLGRLELRSSPTLITREDGKRTISVTAGISKGTTVQKVNTDLETFARSLPLPSDYSWKTGGVNEENQNSVTSILTAMILSFLLILVTMVLQFSSFRKAFIVLLVIPLSISGVFVIFALTNTFLSFPALIGVLALFGIVVKNAILIVDKIQANEKTRMTFEEAIAEGAASRLEAIALTSFTAILGLLPITLSDPLWRGLGGAIIAGLTFSGTIMLFFIPVVYYLIFKPQRRIRKAS